MMGEVCDSGRRREVTLVRPATLRTLRIALLVAALFAVLFQSFIVQAHAHTHHVMGPTVHSVAMHPLADEGSTQPDESDCPICWEMAHAGVFVLPGNSVPLAPKTSAIWVAVQLPSFSVRNERSHAWRSRAPPRPIQA